MILKTICIIDDDPIYQLITKKIIEKNALFSDRQSFTDGFDALHFFRSEKRIPDIILLDIEMPAMDGWDFLDEFCDLKKGFDQKIAIYVISSSIAKEDIEKAKTYDCITGFISKPINLEKLKKIANS
ncbi:response regulator [Flavobacterium sp.]|uniref:response regulator n=1 Tax=Flavobacterium sp. TaxID=239 RepID=UPI003D6A2ADD